MMPAFPPQPDEAQLVADRVAAVALFREQRTTEPLDHYLAFYRSAFATFSEILNVSHDLRQFPQRAAELLVVKEQQDLCRYLASPPLSEDDLKTLGDTSLAVGVLARDPGKATELAEFIVMGMDQERFPWVAEDRDPTAAERHTALVSTCAMFAMRKMETYRRTRGKNLEQQVKEYLEISCGMKEISSPGSINNATQGPATGEFCGETSVVGGKADIVVRLFDGRLLPIECKVSNSETNSYKRLIHDCGEKSQAWVSKLGPNNCIPAAVLSGCYSLGNLHKAQDMGLMLVWSHDLTPLRSFLNATKD